MLFMPLTHFCLFFFFNDTATTEIYTLSLHDALPILQAGDDGCIPIRLDSTEPVTNINVRLIRPLDRKSTRLNSSHSQISYAVFCLKKKKETSINTHHRLHISMELRRTTENMLRTETP